MLGDLLDRLCAVDDPRQAGKVEHRLADVLAISVCAVLAGAESFEDIALYGEAKRPWLSRHLALTGGIPSHDTVRQGQGSRMNLWRDDLLHEVVVPRGAFAFGLEAAS